MTNIVLPARVQVRIDDNASGALPTRSRLGDKYRTGRFESAFDDTRTLIFTQSSVSYPSLLPVSSQFIQQQSSSLSATAIIRAGIADARILSKNDGAQQFTPFNETFAVNDLAASRDPFYLTGSLLQNVGLGFTSPLVSKTSITIDIEPIVSSTFRMLGTTVNTATSSYPMQYFNHQLRRWEGVGIGESIDWDLATIGFHQSGRGSSATNRFDARVAGLPIDTFGFPSNPRYHASSSQLFALSGVLDRPFIVEKMVLEFSATLDSGSQNLATAINDATVTSFFILNQRKPFNTSYIFSGTTNDGFFDYVISSSIPSSLVLSRNAGVTYVDTTRDLVTFAHVTGYPTGGLIETAGIATPEGGQTLAYVRDLNIYSSTPAPRCWAGKFMLSASIKESKKIDGFATITDGGPQTINTNYLGGRMNLGISTGRGLINDLSASPLSGTALVGGFEVPGYAILTASNPYILLPTDNLIFGWQVPWTPSMALGYGLTLHPGAGKLTLYGSSICLGVEKHDTLNSAMTTLSAYEMITGGDDIVDQFETEPRQLFLSSSLTDYVTGSLSSSLYRPRTAVASAVAPLKTMELAALMSYQDNEETARSKVIGFSRTRQAASDNERFYDTIMPKIDDIVKINGGIVYSVTSGGFVTNRFIIGHSVVTLGFTPDETWHRAFPFENKYSTVSRLLSPTVTLNTNLYGGVAAEGDDIIARPIYQKTRDATIQSLSSNDSALRPVDDKYFLLHSFGIGDDVTGSVKQASNPNSLIYLGAVARGFKYGILNALPQFTKAHFRSSRYGQVRDMLEQRWDSKFYDTVGLSSNGDVLGNLGVRTGPVIVKFVQSGSVTQVSPYTTDSSNMSQEVTSSVPYFDGIARNR